MEFHHPVDTGHIDIMVKFLLPNDLREHYTMLLKDAIGTFARVFLTSRTFTRAFLVAVRNGEVSVTS